MHYKCLFDNGDGGDYIIL